MTEDWNGYQAPRPEGSHPPQRDFQADVAEHGPQGLQPEPMPLLGPTAGTAEWADWAETREWRLAHDAIVTLIEILGDWLPEGFDRLKERERIVRAREIAAERMKSGWRTVITPKAIHQHRQEERLERLDAVLEGEHDGLSFDRKALETLLMYVDCGLGRPEEAVFYRTPEMRIDELLQANNRLVAQRRELEARISVLEHDAQQLRLVERSLDLHGLRGARPASEALDAILEEMAHVREVLSPGLGDAGTAPLGDLAERMAVRAADAVALLGAVDVAAEPLLTVLDFVGVYVVDVEPVNGVNVGMLRALRDALNGRPAAAKQQAAEFSFGDLAQSIVGAAVEAANTIANAINGLPQHRYAIGDELGLFVRIDDVRQIFGVPKPVGETADPFVIMEREGWATVVTTTSLTSGEQVTEWQFSHPETGRQCMGHGPDADSARRAAIAQLIAPIFIV